MYVLFFIFSLSGCEVSAPLSLTLHIFDLFILRCNISELLLPFVTLSDFLPSLLVPSYSYFPSHVSLHFSSTSSQFHKISCLLFSWGLICCQGNAFVNQASKLYSFDFSPQQSLPNSQGKSTCKKYSKQRCNQPAVFYFRESCLFYCFCAISNWSTSAFGAPVFGTLPHCLPFSQKTIHLLFVTSSFFILFTCSVLPTWCKLLTSTEQPFLAPIEELHKSAVQADLSIRFIRKGACKPVKEKWRN